MPSLRTYRRDAAAQLGLLDVYTTTGTPAGAEAASTVLVEAFKGALGQTPYEHAWVYPTTGANAELQRPTMPGGLTAQDGSLLVIYPWPAPLTLGTEVEILRLIPATRELGRDGWREIINDVLRTLPTTRRYPIVATDGVHYTVPAWLTSEDQAIGIYAPGSETVASVPSGNLKSIRINGEVMELELWSGYSTGSTFYLGAYQPQATRIKSGGAWADGADGLVADDDEATPPRELVRALAIQRAADIEVNRPDPRNKAMWERALERWTPLAASLKRRLVPARPHPTMTIGVSSLPSWPKGIY